LAPEHEKIRGDKVDAAARVCDNGGGADGRAPDGSANVKAAKEPEEPRDEAEIPAKDAGKPAVKVVDDASVGELKTAMSSQLDDLFATVRRLESFALEEAKRVSAKVLPHAESKAKQNIWVSLIFALGLGLILGLWLNGRRRD